MTEVTFTNTTDETITIIPGQTIKFVQSSDPVEPTPPPVNPPVTPTPPPVTPPPTTPEPEDKVDVFGIPIFNETNPDGLLWTSEHWNNGNSREVSKLDPDDPTQISQRTGNGEMFIDGENMMKMGGSQPRIYFKKEGVFYKNTEITGYFRRIGTDGADNGGFSIGCRSHPEGHSSNNDNNGNATTYYARLRNDGKIDFAKELTHPKSGTVNSSRYYDGDLPSDKWIGAKFIVYTNEEGHVKLEHWLDEVSEGESDKIGNKDNWKLINEYLDDGNWEVQIESKYEDTMDPKMIISEGYGVCLIRNTDINEAQYKYVSLREIIPPSQ